MQENMSHNGLVEGKTSRRVSTASTSQTSLHRRAAALLRLVERRLSEQQLCSQWDAAERLKGSECLAWKLLSLCVTLKHKCSWEFKEFAKSVIPASGRGRA